MPLRVPNYIATAEADSNWITTARGTAFPVAGGAAPKQAAGKGKPATKPAAKKPAGKK